MAKKSKDTVVTLSEQQEKDKAFAKAKQTLEEKYGKGTLMTLGDADFSIDVESVSSGFLGLDAVLGVGGYPRGRIIEIYGAESSGKTTLALHAIASAQVEGGIVAFVDAEHALDPSYAQNLGVDLSRLELSQPSSGEQALEIVEVLVRSGGVDMIVVDSVASLTPQAEIDGDMGDAQMGLHARLMSQAMRKLTAIVGSSNTILIFINQTRMKIGHMVWGNPTTTTGGMALKFYASLRLSVTRTGSIKSGNDVIGNATRVKAVKNKVAMPLQEWEAELIFGQGFSQEADLLDIGVVCGVIDQAGSWFSFEGERIGQGREAVKELFKSDDGLYDKIQTKVLEYLVAEG